MKKDRKKQVIIIPQKEEDKVFISTCEGYHLIGLRKFISIMGLNINVQPPISTPEVARDLVKEGYCVMLTNNLTIKNEEDEIAEEIKHIEIFIPEQVTEYQFEYFVQNKRLSTYNIVIYKYYQDGTLKIINKRTTEKPVLEKLLTELENNIKVETKTRKLIKK